VPTPHTAPASKSANYFYGVWAAFHSERRRPSGRGFLRYCNRSTSRILCDKARVRSRHGAMQAADKPTKEAGLPLPCNTQGGRAPENQHQPPGGVCGAEREFKASIRCAHAQATRTPFARSPAREKVQVAGRVQAGHQKRVGKQRLSSGAAPQAECQRRTSRRFRASPQRLTPKQRSCGAVRCSS
jgi:hypothetical protein